MKLPERLKSILGRWYDAGRGTDDGTDDEDSYWEEVGAKREEYDEESLRRLHQDFKFTLNQHLSGFSEISERAGRLFRFNGLVVTILIAVGSQINYNDFLNNEVKSGIALLLFSALIGLGGQLLQSVRVGTGPNDFAVHDKAKLREHEYIRWIISTGYIDWIETARRKSKRKARIVTAGYLLSIVGLILIIWGIYLVL